MSSRAIDDTTIKSLFEFNNEFSHKGKTSSDSQGKRKPGIPTFEEEDSDQDDLDEWGGTNV